MRRKLPWRDSEKRSFRGVSTANPDDFLDASDAFTSLLKSILLHGCHGLLGGGFYFRAGFALQNQFSQFGINDEQLKDPDPTPITGFAAFGATRSGIKTPMHATMAERFQFRAQARWNSPFDTARRANSAHQSLGQHPLERGG